MTAADMTAAEIVALAEYAAYRIRTVDMNGDFPWNGRCVSIGIGGARAYGNDAMPGATLHVVLSPENTASRDALKRALLASAATYDVHAGEYRATIGDDSYSVGADEDDGDGNPRRLTRVSDAEAQRLWETARDILIEHLLGATGARV